MFRIKGNGFLNINTVGDREGEEGKIGSNCQRIVQKNDHMEERLPTLFMDRSLTPSHGIPCKDKLSIAGGAG